MHTVGSALQQGVAHLEAAGVEEARRTAEWLLEHLTGSSRARLHAFPERPLDAAQRQRFAEGIARRAAGEPVQYITGEAFFYGLALQVTPAVLIPRPETEEVVARALAQVRAVATPRIADAGTGSGCIALACKHARPDARVAGFDVSPEALAVARANAHALGLDVAFARADLLAGELENIPTGLDLLVSNPPYIPDGERGTLARHVRDFEPGQALFCGAEPYVFYEALARHALHHVRPGGSVVVETHADYAGGVARRFEAAGLVGVRVSRDLAGRERMVEAQRPV